MRVVYVRLATLSLWTDLSALNDGHPHPPYSFFLFILPIVLSSCLGLLYGSTPNPLSLPFIPESGHPPLSLSSERGDNDLMSSDALEFTGAEPYSLLITFLL